MRIDRKRTKLLARNLKNKVIINILMGQKSKSRRVRLSSKLRMGLLRKTFNVLNKRVFRNITKETMLKVFESNVKLLYCTDQNRGKQIKYRRRKFKLL